MSGDSLFTRLQTFHKRLVPSEQSQYGDAVAFSRGTAELVTELIHSWPAIADALQAAQDEHEEKCGCTGEACALGGALDVLFSEPPDAMLRKPT